MAQRSPVFSTAAALPNELHREIIENVFGPKDRATLFCCALVSKAWSKDSARVLYREFYDDWVDEHDKRRVLLSHLGFLRAITDNPTRLGPLVRAYGQTGLIPCNYPNTIRIRGLTTKALRAMVNLQYLHLITQGGGTAERHGLNPFDGCTFRLRTLVLSVHFDGTGRFDFLHPQTELRHLRIVPVNVYLSSLPEDVFPNLLSASCVYQSMAQMTKGRKLIALETMLDFDAMEKLQLDPYTLDFGRLRYVSLWIQARGRSTSLINLTGNDITILKLQVYNIEGIADDIRSWHLPNLLILVILDEVRTSDKPSFRRALAHTFNDLPSLDYVIMQGVAVMSGFDIRFSVAERDYNGEVSKVWDERIHLRHDPIEPWWTAYDSVQNPPACVE